MAYINGNETLYGVVHEVKEVEDEKTKEFLTSLINGSLTEVQRVDIDELEELRDGLFGYCALNKIDLKGNKLKSLKTHVFQYDTKLSKVFIPKQIENIGDYCFYRCSGLKTLVMESETPPIGGYLMFAYGPFEGNSGDIFVPFGSLETYKSATNWSRNAGCMEEQAPIEVICGVAGRVLDENGNDYDCTCAVFPSGTEEIQYAMYDEATLAGATPPSFIYLNDGLKMIMDYAFLGARITEIDIPSSVTYIGEFAFESYGNLKDVYIYCENPPFLGNGFGNVAKEFKIHIPYGTLDKYQKATNWAQYDFVEDRKL